MKRSPLKIFATLCLPLFVLGCPDDAPSDEEVGDTDTSTDESTDDDESTTTDDDESTTTTDDAETETDDEAEAELTTNDDAETETDETETADETAETAETAEETGGVCGDMVIDGNEDCEGADLGGADCVSLGFAGGELICGADCLFDQAGCFNAECGNGTIDGDEQCDLDDLGGQTCVDLGYAGGELSCADDCTLIEDACSNCGNGVLDEGEACDGDDLGGLTCETEGFEGGELSCADDCSPDISGCGNEIVLCNETDTPIPDSNVNGVTIPIVVPDMGTIVDIDISIQLNHTWLADLEVSLDRDGQGAAFMFRDIANIGGGVDSCQGNNMIATLDDAAATSIQTDACTNALVPAVNGTHQPEQPLAGFNGLGAAATWNLRVVDDAGADLGTVTQWCVTIFTQ